MFFFLCFPQQHYHKSSLKDLRSLQECVQFINHWKEQVDQVCKVGLEGGKDRRLTLWCITQNSWCNKARQPLISLRWETFDSNEMQGDTAFMSTQTQEAITLLAHEVCRWPQFFNLVPLTPVKGKPELSPWISFVLPLCNCHPITAICCVWHGLTACGLVFQKGRGDPEEGSSKQAHSSDPRTERSLEESRKLILEWADELHHVDKVGPHATDYTAIYKASLLGRGKLF